MDLKQLLREAGVIGAGGAGFPSYAKLGTGADTLLINAAECEPLLFTDYVLLMKELDRVTDGARLVADALGVTRILLGVKRHRGEHLGWTDGTTVSNGVTVCFLPDVYPLGDEINLIYQMTGRLVQPGALPITEHVVVYNVETLMNVSYAVREGKPVTEKWLTVAGDIPEGAARVVRVPIGMRVSALFEKLGITVPETHVCIDGGPSMGNVISEATALVRKNTKGLLVLPRTIPAMMVKLRPIDRQVNIANAVCCQCSACTEMCSRALLGYPLEPHRLVRAGREVVEAFPEQFTSASLCSGCGICEISACGQFISPKAVIALQKSILAKNKLRFKADRVYRPDPERDARMVPSARWRSLLGVTRYHHMPAYGGFLPAEEVSVALNTHIGAPSSPSVKVGDQVQAGQVIATAAEGLSVAQHASIDGRVVYVDDKVIRIAQS